MHFNRYFSLRLLKDCPDTHNHTDSCRLPAEAARNLGVSLSRSHNGTVKTSDRRANMADDTPVLEEAPRPTGGSGGGGGDGSESGGDRNNRGNFTRNLNKEPDEAVARKMFFGGLALLPWLHLVNVVFFRRQFQDPSVDPKVTLCTYRSLVT